MCASVHVRSAEPEEDHLQTPNCSNTGYEDEEDHHGDDHPGDEAEVSAVKRSIGSTTGCMYNHGEGPY